jgi:signal peptide peptidase SppA
MIRGAQTPVTAIANTLAGSAAYWLASQADEVVVSPSGFVGSIGVFARHVDESAALAQEGLKVTLISAGDYKVEGNPYEPLSDEAQAAIQALVNETYDAFVNDVAAGRNVSAGDVLAGFGQGRMFSAQGAVAAGLADRVDTFASTVQGLLAAPPSLGGQRAERAWVTDHFGPDARVSGECVCGRNMSGKPENGEYAYHGGSHGFYTCHDCGREWLALGNGAMTPKTSPVDPAERPSGADKPAPVNGRVARSLSGR